VHEHGSNGFLQSVRLFGPGGVRYNTDLKQRDLAADQRKDRHNNQHHHKDR
jgi:hypothetical protein